MKLARIVFILAILLSSYQVKANYGCNTGNYIYPNATGGMNPSGSPYYYNTNAIYIRTWDGDAKCGIRDNKIYPRSNGDDNCQIVGSNWGVIYYYNPNDNNCLPLPLDDYTWLLVLVVGATGFYMIRKKLVLES